MVPINSLKRGKPRGNALRDYSIGFKANSPSMRLRLWENIVEKHNAENFFPAERMKILAEKYETAPSGIELAVSNEVLLAKAWKQEKVRNLC